MTATESSSNRTRQQAPQRKQRRRRPDKLEQMRLTVATLENAVPVVLTLDNLGGTVNWDGFLDANAMRVRRLLHQSLELTKEARQLQSTQWQLQRLLREHQVASLVLAGIVNAPPLDNWESKVLHWRRLSRKHYKPWSLEDCCTEVDDVMKEVNALLWSSDTQSSGVSFLGWRDRRHVNPLTQSLQFAFHKDFLGFDVADFVDKVWLIYTNASVYQKLIMGGQGRSSLDVMQKLSPTMWIVRFDERYPMVDVDVHVVYLLFRVQLDDGGYMLCLRSIHSRELQNAINEPQDTWGINCIWLKWEPVGSSHDDFRLYAGGYIAGNDLNYVNRWLVELLASLVRGEAMITRRPLLTTNV